MKIKFLYILLIVLWAFAAKAQPDKGYGGAVLYNLQTQGIGLCARVQLKLYNHLSLVPQIYYFPSFNKIHELYLGANLHYEFHRWTKFTPYMAGGGFYNNWMSYAQSSATKAKQNNILPEGGVGILFGKKCWKPFVEQRYNPVWKEGTFRLGIMYYPGCNTKGPGINKKSYPCPDIIK